MSLLIKPASSNNMEAIQQIAEVTWRVTYQFLPEGQIDYMLHQMYSTQALQQQMESGHQFFIALVNNQIVGFASASKINESTSKLNKLYVLPTIQKTGAGKALLQAVIDYALENKTTELQLQVNRNNNAKDFYTKQGFNILYEADFEIGNGYYMNDYVMGLSL